MRRLRHSISWCLLVAMVMQAFLPDAAVAGQWPFAATTNVQKLASSIDKLQKHLDEYGTVVAKSPDVWGESRLMRHRRDFEAQMKTELNQFQFRLNAAESTRDAAFLASALSLSAALGGNAAPAATGSTPAATSQTQNMVSVSSLVPTGAANGTTTSELVPREDFGLPNFTSNFVDSQKSTSGQVLQLSIEPTIYLDQKKRYLDHLNEIRRLNEGDDTTDTPGYSLNLIRIPVSVLPGRKTKEGWGAEFQCSVRPYLSEELLPMTFRDLVINDVADRIALPVLRLADLGDIKAIEAGLTLRYRSPQQPVPRSTTSSTEAPALLGAQYQQVQFPQSQSPEPAETLFDGDPNGRFAIGYAAQQLGLDPVDPEFQPVIDEALQILRDEGRQPITSDAPAERTDPVPSARAVADAARDVPVQIGALTDLASGAADLRRLKHTIPETQQQAVNGTTLLRVALDVYGHLSRFEDCGKRDFGQRGLHLPDVERFLKDELRASYEFLSQPGAACLWEHCSPELVTAIREVRRWIPQDRYEGLMEDPVAASTLMDPGRARLFQLRKRFFEDIHRYFPELKDTTTGNLSWHLIVHSALLNEQLVKDMQELAAAKNCRELPTDWMAYYGPNPPYEARTAFNTYVLCRWPIHVFALDPITQDQNVGSAFSRRREMQLVLALAATQRAFSMQSLTQFIRRLEYDLETIELNRTAVGFSHGDDTFGWRFYPRVQQPRVPSNMSAAFHDLVGGGPDREDHLNDRNLEPGIRECTALVVMPSFVPYVTVDARSNWFRLTDECHGKLPNHRGLRRQLDLRDAVDLSAEVTSLKTLTQACVKDAHLYRQGEVHRLVRAVSQLDKQLPLQTMYVPVPHENSLGGSQMFNTGATALAPELIGWYGEPGIRVAKPAASAVDAAASARQAATHAAQAQAALAAAIVRNDPKVKEFETAAAAAEKAAKAALDLANLTRQAAPASTSIYLVGRNFSVLDTNVVAGGVHLEDADIDVISREVIRVVIPSSVATVVSKQIAEEACGEYVDIHLATPYGVTSHLHVPVAEDSSSASANAIQQVKAEILKEAKAEAKKEAEAAVGQLAPTRIQWIGPDGNAAAAAVEVCQQGRPFDFALLSELFLADLNESPLMLDLSGDFGCFASYRKKGKTADTVIMDGPRKRPFVGTHPVEPAGDYFAVGDFHVVVAEVLASIGDLTDVESITIHGFIRHHEPTFLNDGALSSHPDAGPIRKLPDLKILIRPCPRLLP